MKFERKIYKYNAKRVLKHNYIYIMALCFLVAFVTSEFRGSTRIINRYNTSEFSNQAVQSEKKQDIAKMITGDENYKKDISTFRGIATELSIDIYADINESDSFISSIVTTSMRTVYKYNLNSRGLVIFIGVVGICLSIFVYIGFKVVLLVGRSFYLLESRDHIYSKNKVPMVQVLNNFRRSKWLHTSYVMFLRWLFNGLWDLTIIGGIIKRYEYSMIPYILADETSLSRKEIFKLSKEMVRGYKMQLFINDLSFIGWTILENLTFGLVGIFYYVPYKSAELAEIYLCFRANAIDNNFEGACKLDKNKYIQAMNEYRNIEVFEAPDVVIIPKKEIDFKYKQWYFGRINPGRKYKIVHYFGFFFTFAIIGWIYEVGIHLVEDGEFVNRGVLHGPWLPIYGVGGVVALTLFKKYYKKPIFVFFASMFTASVIEYVTSWYLEMVNGVRWWDYSGYSMNINGRICLLGAVIFGIGGCLIIYILAPLLANLYEKVFKKHIIAICIIIAVIFTTDAVYSTIYPNTGTGVTDYNGWQKDE